MVSILRVKRCPEDDKASLFNISRGREKRLPSCAVPCAIPVMTLPACRRDFPYAPPRFPVKDAFPSPISPLDRHHADVMLPLGNAYFCATNVPGLPARSCRYRHIAASSSGNTTFHVRRLAAKGQYIVSSIRLALSFRFSALPIRSAPDSPSPLVRGEDRPQVASRFSLSLM